LVVILDSLSLFEVVESHFIVGEELFEKSSSPNPASKTFLACRG
jgi:hypothetical protein